MPGQDGVFQRRPEGRLGALAEQQETRLQAASDGSGRQEHQPLREGREPLVTVGEFTRGCRSQNGALEVSQWLRRRCTDFCFTERHVHMKIKVLLMIHIKHTRVRKFVVTQKQKMMPVLLVANFTTGPSFKKQTNHKTPNTRGDRFHQD